MGNLISVATGNLTSASTWQVADTTSFLQTQTNTQTTSTSFASSAAFTPGAITIDAIGLYFSNRTANPTGTISVRLFDNTAAAAVAGTTVTLSAVNIDTVPTAGIGWQSFSFTPLTLVAGHSYSVQVTSSTSSEFTIYRDATANNFARYLRTTTTQAPVAGDNLLIHGTNNTLSTISYVVTMNDTASTAYGNIECSKGGTLTHSTAASTNWTLKPAGNILIWSNGAFETGNNSSPIPSTSTYTVEFQCTSPVQFGLTANSGAFWNSQGNALTTDRAKLAADAAGGATSLTLNATTNWKNGDFIALASTTVTAAQSESTTLGADASGTSLPTVTALANAHSGTGAIAGEVINLTRNVKYKGVAPLLINSAYVNIRDSAQVSVQWTEFSIMGSATTQKTGFDVGTISGGSCVVQNCSFHNSNQTGSIGVKLNAVLNSGVNISNNVFFSILTNHLVNVASATSGLAQTISGNIGILNGSGPIFNFQNCKITAQNNTCVSGTTAGITLGDITYDGTGLVSGVAHSNGTVGVAFLSVQGVAGLPAGGFGTFTVWRNNSYGIATSGCTGIKIDGVTAFGNQTANLGANGQSAWIYWNNVTSDAGTIQVASVGFGVGGYCSNIFVDNSTFGGSTTHATGDLSFNVASEFADVTFRNCTMNSTTTVGQQANMLWNSAIKFQRLNTTAGNNKAFTKFGTELTDTTIFNVASPSTRMTPSSATVKLEQNLPIKLTIQSGQSATITAFLRKSVVGDGTAYNGNQPRIVLKFNPAQGYATDSVLVTADNSCNGAFVMYTGTVTAPTDNAIAYVVVDCDGTQGWINVDDVKVVTNTANDQGSQKYWDNGVPSTTIFTKTAGALIAGGVIL